MSDQSIQEEAGLWHLRYLIGLNGLLSALTAFSESLALAGVVIRLTASQDAAPPMGIELLSHVSDPAVIISVAMITLLLNGATNILQEGIASRWAAARRVNLIDAFSDADFEVQARTAPAMLTSVMDQVNNSTTVVTASVSLVGNITRAAIYLTIAIATSWRSSVIAIAFGSVLVVGLRRLSMRTRGMNRHISGRTIALSEHFGDVIASSREMHILNRWDEESAEMKVEVDHLRHLLFVARATATMVAPIFVIGSIFVGLAFAEWGRSGPGSTAKMASSGVLLLRALGAIQTCQIGYQQLNDARPYLEKVLGVIADLRARRRVTKSPPAASGGVLNVHQVSLSHGKDTVVSDLDLVLTGPGGIAIVGQSGSGKSTTLLALSGMISPQRGVVTLDDDSLEAIPGETLGRRIGLVPQDPRLLRVTLRANLLRPDRTATDDQLWEAIAAVGLTSTVDGFEHGLDSVLGRGEQGFSGGELQRLGLARLLVNQPDVWLLDEPTSALDQTNAERVAELVAEAMKDHLVVVVTHRPELLEYCDRVIYMNDGRLVDDGTLAEVSRRQAFVSAMVKGADLQ